MIKLKTLAVVSALLVYSSLAMAQVDMTFSGVGNWTDPNLWDVGYVPGDVNLANYANISDANTICTVNTDTGAFAGGSARMQIDGGATLVLEEGGIIAATSWTRIGVSGVGTLEQTGGVFEIQNDKIGIGDKTGGEGYYIMSGGTMTYAGDRGDIAVGSRSGTGTLTIIGTDPVIAMEELIVSERDGSAGTVEFVLEADGVSPIVVIKTTIDSKGDTTESALVVSANAAPPLADILLVDVTGDSTANAFDTVNGAEAVEGAEVVVRGDDVENTYVLTYAGGTGNDIALLYQSTAVVIGDFEDGLGYWGPYAGINADPNLTIGTLGATSGEACLDVVTAGNYYPIQYDGPVLDMREATAVVMDVTLRVDEFADGTWTKVDKLAMNSDLGWMEAALTEVIDRNTGEATDSMDWGTWSGDQDRTLTWDLSGLDLSTMHTSSWFQLIPAINDGSGTGIFHIDNIRIIGAKKKPTVIWVSDNMKPFDANTPADGGFVELLEADAYNVVYHDRIDPVDGSQYWRVLDANKVAELNTADLVIISRNAYSGLYNQVDEETGFSEVNEWNGVTTPMICLSAHLARSSKWNWVNANNTYSNEVLVDVVDPNHAIFEGVAIDANGQTSLLTDDFNVDVLATAEVGNGTLLAARASDGYITMAEWQAGVEFYDGCGQVAGGPRLFFAAGSGTKYSPDGQYNLSEDGDIAFLNAVDYLLP